MKKILLGLILIVSITFGQESKGILYKATKEDKTVYLFGKIYAAEDEVINLSASVKSAFEKSRGVIFLVSPKDYMTDGNMMETNGLSYEKISDSLSKEKYQLLSDRLSEVGISPRELENYKLWVNHFS